MNDAVSSKEDNAYNNKKGELFSYLGLKYSQAVSQTGQREKRLLLDYIVLRKEIVVSHEWGFARKGFVCKDFRKGLFSLFPKK